jgi:DNA-binding beta-propeller fold protein YncE
VAHSDPTTKGTILKFTPTGSSSIFISNLSGATDLTFDPNGNLFVTDGQDPGTIYKITPAGSRSTFTTGLIFPAHIEFAPIPEPASVILFAVGGLAMGALAVARRQMRRATYQL